MKDVRSFATFVWIVLVWASVVPASSQERMSDKDVEKTMSNLKDDAKKFRSDFNSAVGKSTIRKTSEEKDAKALVERFQKETEQMLDHFKSSKKVDTDLPQVRDTADQIDKLLKATPMGDKVTGGWERLKAELGTVTSAFGMSSLPK